MLSLSAVILVACENPADKTDAAKVGDAVEKTTTTAAGGVKYVFTPESEINFVGSKVTGSHKGGFKEFEGHFFAKDGEPIGTDHTITIDMNSTWADDEKLTGHLKSPDFFDVEKFPQAKFEVTEVKKESDTKVMISGNFTLHGVTKNITFPATVDSSPQSVEIEAKFDVNRKDFKIVYPGKPDDLIRDEVVIELKLVAKSEV
ncbi:MAG: YceI family protein [Armatimonadetes bacterium]|nr:YceI family protein [Akkermansiaceae bacterium]